MVAKTSPARQRAFLAALAASGNIAIASARAKVSPVWSARARARDPAFRAAFNAALAQADARLRQADAQPLLPGGRRYLDGEELVIYGSRGRRVMIRRARPDQWTLSCERRFLGALAATCNVRSACAAAGKGITSAYEHRQRSADFGRRWQAALEDGYERLEMALVDGAIGALEGRAPADDDRIERISFEQAVTLLKLHQLGAIGRGVQIRPRARATPEETDAALIKLLDRTYRVMAAKEARAAARAG